MFGFQTVWISDSVRYPRFRKSKTNSGFRFQTIFDCLLKTNIRGLWILLQYCIIYIAMVQCVWNPISKLSFKRLFMSAIWTLINIVPDIWNPNCLKTKLWKVQISDTSGFQKFGFQEFGFQKFGFQKFGFQKFGFQTSTVY